MLLGFWGWGFGNRGRVLRITG